MLAIYAGSSGYKFRFLYLLDGLELAKHHATRLLGVEPMEQSCLNAALALFAR